ncbi:MAG: hypothetical protein IPO50_12220 [Sphingomonadales bacterium]|nr:hypothetical protein [Sphingomonadales bacterium]
MQSLGIRQLADQEEPCAADLAWIVQAFPIKEQGHLAELVGPELTLISPIFSRVRIGFVGDEVSLGCRIIPDGGMIAAGNAVVINIVRPFAMACRRP